MDTKYSKKSANVIRPGTLYVVATPIGNREDITLRALNILREVDLIAAEDTRKTRRFLALHDIKNRLISYHEHNEAERTPELTANLQTGTSIALVCNAGTPTVSDPGYRLIEAALANNLKVIPIPGVSAATAALSVSGLPTDSYVFVGFLPRKKAKRLRLLSEIKSESRTVIFYESPKRILMLLSEISDTMGNRHGVLAREMTKLHEEFIRGRLSQLQVVLKDRPDIKGECTLLIAGNDSNENLSWPEIRQQIEAAVILGQNSLSAIAREIASTSGVAKNKIYAEALKISKNYMAPKPISIPHSAFRNHTLFPVILPVPEQAKEFRPKDRVTFLSRHARCALERSAEKSGIRLDELPKDENGAPLPVGGVYWSITHKTNYVGGVVAPAAIGIDIERIRSCSPALFLKTAGEQEWALAKTAKNSLKTFFRFWTSKEAVVKACGTGIKDLRKCRIRRILDADHLEIRYEGKNWLIEQFFFDGHIASIVKDNFKLDWGIEK